MTKTPLALLLLMGCLGAPSLWAVDFNRDVRPILSDKCFACHGPDEHDRKADLRLDTKEGAFADLGGYAAFVPGDPKDSEGWLRIIAEDPDEVMPPPKAHKEMSAEEKAIIKEWIEDGAPFELHWAFQALERPEVPETGDKWAQSAIDHFVRQAQYVRGMEPSPSADPATLARRLHLDLLGLPPDPTWVDKFASNPSAETYSSMVDELLENPAFGERMAVYWLDLVRYADTIGYHSDNFMEVSAYREYVIDAFNRNLPYDRFTIEQLAGDLLPNPTLEQRVASGYNRLLQSTEEGGAQAQEYMAIHAADRVRNVSAVWLGSTIGCAQCHDHKYDPFSMKDFYSLAAFFADVKEKPIGKRQPNLKLPTEAEQAELASLKQNLEKNTLAKLLERDPKLRSAVAKEQEDWEQKLQAQLRSQGETWTVSVPSKLQSSGRSTLTRQPDGSVLSSGRNPNQDHYTIDLSVSGKVAALRLEALTHETLVKKSLARGNGNFVLSEFQVKLDGQPIEIAAAKADYSQDGWPVEHAIDGKAKTGWAGNGHVEGKDRTAVFVLAKPLELQKGNTLTVELRHASAHPKHNIGRFRLSVSADPQATASGGPDVPVKVLEILKLEGAERNPKQVQTLAAHYQTIAPSLETIRKDREQWTKRITQIENGLRTMLVSESLETPRMTRILNRGNWLDESGDVVEPSVPVFLPHEEITGRRANRLDLAQWIVADSNPLTARTFVNRMWKLFFGAGISKNLDDLGGQGVPPTHPELLDWLAVEFQDSGWDVKHLIRLMLHSATYQQSSIPSQAMAQADPGNQWLTRQGRWRLEAEFVRDVALDLSGLLVNEQGGTSVKPYQPAGYWQHLNFPKRKWEAGKGEDLYRRGLYTFWCRSFLHPAMLAFDAPSREECTAERARSNTPQQALVLLNDPVFVEASRVFAQRILQQPAPDDARIHWAWKEAVSRDPSQEEQAILRKLADLFRERYAKDPASAQELLSVGEAPLPEGMNTAELATWTQVARSILNAYETTSRN